MEDPSDNLYMTNLPAGITEAIITEVFAICGVVKQCRVLPSRGEGSSAALVRFETVEEAQAIVMSMNGTTLPGFEEPVSIKFASPQRSQGTQGGGYGKWQDQKQTSTPWSGGGGQGGSWAGGGGGSWSDPPPPSDNLYVKGLPQGTDEAWFKEALAGLAMVTSVRILNYETTDGTCAAMARFASIEDATRVKETLHGQSPEWCPTQLDVKFARSSKGGGKGGEGSGGSSGKSSWSSGGSGGSSGKSSWSSGGGSSWSGKGGGGGAAAADPELQAQDAWIASAGGVVGNGTKVDAESLVTMVQEAEVLPGNGPQFQNPDGTIYIAGLPGDTKKIEVYQLFSPFGAIISVSVKTGEARGKTPAWAISFVNYVDPLSAQAAIAVYNGMQIPDGTTMRVSLKNTKGQANATPA